MKSVFRRFGFATVFAIALSASAAINAQAFVSGQGLKRMSVDESSVAAAPPCRAKGVDLQQDDARVLELKRTTPNQFKTRAHIIGTLEQNYPDRPGHRHLEVRIGQGQGEFIEVIYNEDFGEIPDDIAKGTVIEACGDYITANMATAQYPASPDGAIIHWIHRSPRPELHDSGYLIINGRLFGQGTDRNPGAVPGT